MTTDGVASQFELVLLGADDPLGESFLKALEDSDVQVGRLHPLVLGDPESIVAFRGEEWPCLSAEGFDFSLKQVLVVASPSAAARRVVEQVRASHPFMPVLTMDEVIPAPALAVTRLLQALAAPAGDLRAEAFVTLPVALMGKPGVDELVNQSRGLFNMESPDPEVFPLQIAFNLLPQMDQGPQRYAPTGLTVAVAKALPEWRVGFSVAWAPVFYGAVTALHVRLEQPLEVDVLRQILTRQEGICLMESDLPAGNPTPATDSAESADIFLGQMRAEGSDVRFWLVYDPLRLEAVQLVSAVENWIDKPTNSMLT